MSLPQWTKDLDLSRKDSTIQVYTDDTLVQQIKTYANRRDLSQSQAAANLLLEGLLSANTGGQGRQPSQTSPSELQERVQELEEKLEAERNSEAAGLGNFEPRDVKNRLLTDQYQSFDELKAQLSKSGLIDEAVLQPLENQLWKLVAWNEAEFQRGHGWKLLDGENGGGSQ